MKSTILEKGEEYFTNMKKTFNAIGNEQLNYNWLITDCECYPQDEELQELFLKEYTWISGERLTEIVDKEDLQFIWAVFSGFFKEIALEDVLQHDLPFADGYEGFWEDNVGIQHPLADIEIVAWDGSLTLFISKNDSLVQKFRRYFTLSEDLSAQNTRDNSEIAHIEKLLIQELTKKDILINEDKIYKKYFIWNRLYSKREKIIRDEDILKCIDEIFS